MALPFRVVARLGLAAALAACPAGVPARTAGGAAPSARAWAATVITQIAEADLKASGTGERGASVTLRVRIAADGTLDGAAIEGGSGSAERDERALKAVRAAAPFPSPPRAIVTLEGYTEISFPLNLAPATR